MASVYKKKGGRWWLRFKGADGCWHGAPAKASTKPAARLEALERERLARQQREGLAPNDDNRRRTFERDIAAAAPVSPSGATARRVAAPGLRGRLEADA